MDREKMVKACALFLALFGAGDILYQLAYLDESYSHFLTLANSFLWAGRWHDFIGGGLCLLAAAGLYYKAGWGVKLSFAMTAGYANLLAYINLMFFTYSGLKPDVFFGLPWGAVQSVFAALFVLHCLAAAALWQLLAART